MRAVRNCVDQTGCCSRAGRQRVLRALQFLLGMALAGTPLCAQPPAPPDQAKFYLGEYSKQLEPLLESKFAYSARVTRSTPGEGPLARWETRGTVAVSATRRLFHYTQSGGATWTKSGGPVTEDFGTTEILVTPEAVFTILADKKPSPDALLTVYLKQPVARDDWSKTLAERDVALFLGYLPGVLQERLKLKDQSLPVLSRTAPLTAVQSQDVNSNKLAGFSAKIGDLQIHTLFDPARGNLLRQVDLSRPVAKVEPFGLVRETLQVLAAERANQLPSSFRFNVITEMAGGVLKQADVPKGVRVAPEQVDRSFESQRLEAEFQITGIVYREGTEASWFKLENSIPDRTTVVVNGDYDAPYFWQDGQVKQGYPPPTELDIREAIAAAFDPTSAAMDRYRIVLRDMKLSDQHGLVVFADPEQESTRQLYATCLATGGFQPALSNFRILGVATSADYLAAARELARLIGVTLPEGGEPLLAIIDKSGRLLGRRGGRELTGTEANTMSSAKVQKFLEDNLPPTMNAETLLADALAQARRENKRVLLQQTATWCGPCRLLSRFLDGQRSVWEKDYVWVQMDERWSHFGEVMRPIRRDDTTGVPWLAILSSEGKTLATSDAAGGRNIGFPTANEPEGIEHFLKMLKSTAQRLTDEDLETLRKSLQGK